MKNSERIGIASMALALALVAWIPAAVADGADAMCQVRKDGETKHGASGPCTFSQRHGYVDIDLRNGDTYNLRPKDEPGVFKDQRGNKVKRTHAGGDSMEFKWPNKKIIVTFNRPSDYRGQHPNSGKHHGGGGTPRDLQNLVRSNYVGGEVDDEMMRRGYSKVRNAASGPDLWSYWRERSSRRCVVVHMTKSRHVSAINYVPDSDCHR
jgi:hypothetical protein